MVRWWLICVAALALSCPGGAAVCEQLQTRCLDNAAQVCNSHGQWESVMDCDDVEGRDTSWLCGEDEGEHTCLPYEEEEAP